MPEDPGTVGRDEARALAELALCENLSQTSGWAAKWSADLAHADGALLWAPDAIHPLFLCIATHGEGTRSFQRRSVPRGDGLVQDLIKRKKPLALDRDELASSTDPWVAGLPRDIAVCIAVPLEAESIVVGLLALLFRSTPNTRETLGRLQAFFEHAAPALGRALRSERKTVGMLHAIERLTNLYDLTKAFGSTIDLEALNAIIVRKAVDFGTAEVASFWLLDENADLVLAATVVNENYEVANAPDSVGGSLAGDLVAEGKAVRRNAIPADEPVASEAEGYPIRSVLAFPLAEDDQPIGALVLVNKRGRHPEFSAEDEELLGDLARQAVRALRNARQYEAEKKVEELDALLAVSREITSTLDLDKVMQKIVHATAALIPYDQCAIAILDRGKLRLGALSGSLEIDRKDPVTRTTAEILEWVYLGGADVAVAQDDEGRIESDRPETQEKFRGFFQETGFRSFHGLLLNDEEGKLGVLSFAGVKPLGFEGPRRDLLAILVNQATVAVRNAQLYREVPLPTFLKPIAAGRKRLLEIPSRRRLAYALGGIALAIFLFAVPWRLRVGGAARILPGRRAAVTAGVDGIVRSVQRREGDAVAAGELIATLDPEGYRAALEEARANHRIAEAEMARFEEAGDATNMSEARSRRDELASRIVLEEDRLARTQLKAPIAGIIVTPLVEQRVGQLLTRGTELCVVADAGTVTAEVAIPEEEASRIRVGERVALKVNPYPTRTFRGEVLRVGSHIRVEGQDRFLVSEVGVELPDGLLKTGMLGQAKVSTDRMPIAWVILRKPFRYVWGKLWPLLP